MNFEQIFTHNPAAALRLRELDTRLSKAASIAASAQVKAARANRRRWLHRRSNLARLFGFDALESNLDSITKHAPAAASWLADLLEKIEPLLADGRNDAVREIEHKLAAAIAAGTTPGAAMLALSKADQQTLLDFTSR